MDSSRTIAIVGVPKGAGRHAKLATVSLCQSVVSACCHQYFKLPELSGAVMITELPVHAIALILGDLLDLATGGVSCEQPDPLHVDQCG
jgi:hypothetical protein